MTKRKKNDLTPLLRAIDTNDLSYYDKIQDSFSDWVTMRWASSCKTNYMWYLLYTNTLVNKNFSDCKDHPKLQWMSVACVGDGTNNYYQWIPPGKKRKSNKSSKFFAVLSEIHSEWKHNEIETFIKLNTEEDIADYIDQHGDKFQ